MTSKDRDPLNDYLRKVKEWYLNGKIIEPKEIDILREHMTLADIQYVNNTILKLLEQGDHALARGEGLRAIRDWQEALYLDPTNPDLYHRLATGYLDRFLSYGRKMDMEQGKKLVKTALIYEKGHYQSRKLLKRFHYEQIKTPLRLIGALFLIIIVIAGAVISFSPSFLKIPRKKEPMPQVIPEKRPPIDYSLPLYLKEEEKTPFQLLESSQELRISTTGIYYKGIIFLLHPSEEVEYIRAKLIYVDSQGVTQEQTIQEIQGTYPKGSRIPLYWESPEFPKEFRGALYIQIMGWQKGDTFLSGTNTTDLEWTSPRPEGIILETVSSIKPARKGIDSFLVQASLLFSNKGEKNINNLTFRLHWVDVQENPLEDVLLTADVPPLKPGQSTVKNYYKEFPYKDYPDAAFLPEYLKVEIVSIEVDHELD